MRFIDKTTGETILAGEESRQHNRIEAPRISRARRWALKSVVNKILPLSRTSSCQALRAPIKNKDTGVITTGSLKIRLNSATKKAYYKGLMACGSVWLCPVCAAKISERRRIELKEGLETAKNKGLKAHFVTLTFPHGVGDNLTVIKRKMSKAYGKLSNGKYSVKTQLKNINPDYDITGFIRAVEVTHGKNGFHPHVHMIVLTPESVTCNTLELIYKNAWSRACRLSGLPIPHDIYGCTVKDGSKAADYASKWGLEDEMTKSNTKVVSRKGVTPWGLLDAILNQDNDEYSPERAEKLFKIYASAFKGGRQLYWSNGLKKLLDLGVDLTDEEIASKEGLEGDTDLAELNVEQWRIIRKYKIESKVLDIAEIHGRDKLLQFIFNLTGEDSSVYNPMFSLAEIPICEENESLDIFRIGPFTQGRIDLQIVPIQSS